MSQAAVGEGAPGLLANRDFVRLFLAQAASLLGSGVTSVALEAAGGPLLAGLLIAAVGVRWALWADGLTSLVSALLVLVTGGPWVGLLAEHSAPAERGRAYTRPSSPERTLLALHLPRGRLCGEADRHGRSASRRQARFASC